MRNGRKLKLTMNLFGRRLKVPTGRFCRLMTLNWKPYVGTMSNIFKSTKVDMFSKVTKLILRLSVAARRFLSSHKFVPENLAKYITEAAMKIIPIWLQLKTVEII